MRKNLTHLIQALLHSHGWKGGEDRLRLSGLSRSRRVIALRRPLMAALLVTGNEAGQKPFAFMETAVPSTRSSRLPNCIATVPGHREYLRRMEPAMRLGRLHDPRPRTLPNHGRHGRVDGQRVARIHATSQSPHTLRGDLQPATVATWSGHANTACRTDTSEDHQHARPIRHHANNSQ